MRAKILLLVLGLGFVAIAIVTTLWWRQAGIRAEVLARAVPAQPDLSGWPDEFRERVEACETAIADGLEPVQRLGELSVLYHANGFYAQADQCYYALEYLDSDNPTWPHRHAIILSGYGDVESALPLLQSVIRLAPGYVPARLRYGDSLLKLNRFEEAIDAYEDVLKQSPDEPYAVLGLGRCEFELGNWEAAREYLEQVVAETQYMLGYDLIVTVYQKLGLDARADLIRGRYRTFGSYRDPRDPWVEVLVRDCYDSYRLSTAGGDALRAGNPKEAVELVELALVYAPDSEAIRYQLGMIHMQNGDWDAAGIELKRCVEIDPGFPDGWVQLRELYTRLGRADEADRYLAEGLRHCPDSPGLQLMDAQRLKRKGDIDAAIVAYRNSIRLRPNEAAAYIELASLLFQRDEIDEGISLLEGALRAEPDQPVALTTLAFAAIMAGDSAGARKWIARASNQPRVDSDDRQRLEAAFLEAFGEPVN